MAGFRPSRVSTGNAVFVACEGLCVPCTATLVSCESEGRALLLRGLDENTNDKLVSICFETTPKHRQSVIFTL